MKKPRYSIIPAGAVTDRRLEGRDLQVLCLIGCFTDKLGWWSGTQGKISEFLSCSRASVQRSLVRLVDAEWLEIKRTSVSYGSRPYAAYAYRVRMDRDDPDCVPSAFEVEAQIRDDDAHGWAPPNPDCDTMPTGEHRAQVPTQDEQGGAHAYVSTEDSRPSKRTVVVDDTRARDPLVSLEAIALAEEIAALAGLPDPKAWPPSWCGAPMRVEAFLREGYHPDVLRTAARAVMAGRKDADPPRSIAYFERAFAKTRAQQEQKLPVVDFCEPQRANNGTRNGAANGGFKSHNQGESLAARAVRLAREASGDL